MASDPRLTVNLFGVFGIHSDTGEGFTPKSQKAQAVLALLATSATLERSRLWLQSMLWSDRANTQAAGSLRQALVQIRNALGEDWQNALICDRAKIALDPAFVQIAADNGQQFLEGLDVRDPAFADWLAERRQPKESQTPGTRFATPVPNRRFISLQSEIVGGGDAEWFAQVFIDLVARHLREFFSAELLLRNDMEISDHLWSVKLNSMTMDGTLGVRCSFEHPASGRQIWSGHQHVQMRGGPPVDDPSVLRLVNELVQAVGDSLIRENQDRSDDPDELCRRAINLLFSTRKLPVMEADQLFVRAHEIEPRGLYLAWRAQLKTIQFIERHFGDQKGLVEEGQALAQQALDLEPNNSMVLATAANTMGHLVKDQTRALLLARKSVLHNPVNPMSWWALSSASSYVGDVKTAYKNAVHARNLALLSPHRFWWDNQVFGAALANGRVLEARRNAESSAAMNPYFRPNLRYLIAFYANEGREEEAMMAAERLKAIEPDFSIDKMMRDHNYPVSLLRKSPGIDLEKTSALI